MKNKSYSTFIAHAISTLFYPFLLAFFCFVFVLYSTPLDYLPHYYKWIVLSANLNFTILFPLATIYLFFRMKHWKIQEIEEQEKRFFPYLITLSYYVLYYFLMERIYLPAPLNGMILATMCIISLCCVLNHWWKVSAHMAGIGGIVGGIVALSQLFQQAYIVPLCIALFCAGLIASSRLFLKRHTPLQMVVGFAIGIIFAYHCIL